MDLYRIEDIDVSDGCLDFIEERRLIWVYGGNGLILQF